MGLSLRPSADADSDVQDTATVSPPAPNLQLFEEYLPGFLSSYTLGPFRLRFICSLTEFTFSNMAPRNGEKSSRSKSRGRGRPKGPQKAASDSHDNVLEVQQQLSPPQSSELPDINQNKSPPEHVSTTQPLSAEDNPSVAQILPSSCRETNDTQHSNEVNEILIGQTSQEDKSALLEMGDNTAHAPTVVDNTITSPRPFPTLSDHFNPVPDDPFGSTPDDPWHFTFTELRNMRSRMLSLKQGEPSLNFSRRLQTVEEKTTTLETRINNNSQQLQALATNTSSVKMHADKNSQQLQVIKDDNASMGLKIDKNSQQVKALEDQIKALKQVVEDQQQTIIGLKQVKNEFKQDKEDFSKKSRKAVTEMNKLVDAQREQVESLKVIRSDINNKSQEQAKQISQLSHDLDHKSLKDKAFRTSHNIVLIGLPEKGSSSAYATAMKFFKNELKLKKLDIDVAYRIGQPPAENRSYIRPLIVNFRTEMLFGR